jgi:uncharacterized protein
MNSTFAKRHSIALAVALLLFGISIIGIPNAKAISSDIVISQIYGGGGNSGAPYKNDFVELFNRGITSVSLNGMSIQYASATGSGYFDSNPVALLSGSLAPGQYYLIQLAGGSNGTSLPPADATGLANISASAGKVALVNSTAGLTCNGGSAPCSTAQLALIKDLVGYGGADFYESAPAPGLSNTSSASRLNNGCTENDNNSLDFSTGNPNPHNKASVFHSCAPNDACSQPYTPIYSIQGSGLSSAITGTVTTQGIVIGDFEGTASLGGFYLQDPAGDGNPATSDGIFVFTGSSNTVSVGQVVRITGYARERYNQTTINGSNADSSAVPMGNIFYCGTGNVSPTDITMPFSSTDYPEQYEGMLVRFPQSLVISEYYNYDRYGEIVVALPLAGEVRPFTGTAINEPGAAANARTLANSLRRITLDDGLDVENPGFLRHPNGTAFSLNNRFRGGDTVTDVVGILGYDFGTYRIQPTGPAEYKSVNPPPDTIPAVGGRLRVAAMNTLNFFLTPDYPNDSPLDNQCGPAGNMECRGADSDQPFEFTRQKDKLISAIIGLDADIVGLNELENTTGMDPLGDPSGLLAGVNDKLGAATYDYIGTGVIGTDAIRVGLVYKPAKVLPVGLFKILDSTKDPRFLDNKNRPSLAQTFEEISTGNRFTVVINHFKSKGSACNDVGDPDLGDGQDNCSQTRKFAAQALVDWLATDPTESGDPDFIILGDLNSYAREDSVKAIEAGFDHTAGTADDFINLTSYFHGIYDYSYVFDGQSGYIDHALASSQMFTQVTGTIHPHINADEPDVFDYDTSYKPSSQAELYEPNGFRSSDHDPVIVGLNLSSYKLDTPYNHLLIIYPNTNLSYLEGGVEKTYTGSMTEELKGNIINAFKHLPNLIKDASENIVSSTYSIVEIQNPVTHISALTDDFYWLSNEDISNYLKLFAPKGLYDSVYVVWNGGPIKTPRGAGGFFINEGTTTFESLVAGQTSWWTEAGEAFGEPLLHEWLHGVCAFYQQHGFAMPDGDADGAESHGYTRSATEGWMTYYRDLMRGEVWEPRFSRNTGISINAWAYGSPRGSSTFFADVPLSQWAFNYVGTIYSAGLTTGYGGTKNYKPDFEVGRDQMAAFLIRAKEGEPASNYCSSGIPFTDVATSGWACPYIKRLNELHITTGYGGTNQYRPELIVSRDQMAAFIVRATEGEPPADYCASGSPFSDVFPTDWACKYIKRLYERGITTGYGGTDQYKPGFTVTRAQMAAFLARAFLSMK